MGRLTDFIKYGLVGGQKEETETQETKEVKEANSNVDLLNIAAVFGPNFSDSSTGFSDMLQRYWGWLYGCIRALAEPVSTVDLKLFRVTGDDMEEITDHPVLELLDKVNNNLTFMQLVDKTIVHKKLTGEAYWYLYRVNGQIDQIWPLRPDQMTPIPGDYRKDEFIKHWNLQIEGQAVQQIATEDVIQFKETHPTSLYRGQGVVEAAFKSLNLELYTEDFNTNFFKNAASTGAILSTEGKLGPESIRRFKKEMEAQYQGYKKAHKTLILDQGTKYQEAGRSQREMEFMSLSEFVEQKIMALMRVSKTMLGMGEDVNRATAETQAYVFTKQNVVPEMRALTDTLNEFLLPQYPGTETMFFDFDDPTPTDDAALTDKISRLVPMVMTQNEAREELNLEGIGPDGDILYTPTGRNTEEEEETPEEGEEQRMIRVPKRKRISPYAKRQIKRIKTRGAYKSEVKYKNYVENLTKEVVKDVKKNKQFETMMERRWKNLVQRNENTIKLMMTAINKVFKEEREKVTKKIERTKKSDLLKIYDEKKWAEKVEAAAGPILLSAYKRQGRIAFQQVEKDFSLNQTNVNAFNKTVRKFSESVSRTQNGEITRLLERGIKDGSSKDEMVKSLLGILGSPSDAERIVRTEVFRATNRANLDAWKQSGVVVGKIWYTALVEVCDWCRPMHGQVKMLDDYHDFQGIPLKEGNTLATVIQDAKGKMHTESMTVWDDNVPPMHPYCRCIEAPITASSDMYPYLPGTPALQDGFTIMDYGVVFKDGDTAQTFVLNKKEVQFLRDNHINGVIQRSPSKDFPEWLQGKYNPNTRELLIRQLKDIPKQKVSDTFYHEFGHAIDRLWESEAQSQAVSLFNKDKNLIECENVAALRLMRQETIDFKLAEKYIKDIYKARQAENKTYSYFTKKKEVFTSGYVAYKRQPKLLKKYAPKIYNQYKKMGL